MYLLKLALRPWRTAPLSQVFSALAVGFLLGISGFLLWMDQGLKPVIHRLRSEQVITAYVSPEYASGEEPKLVDAIRVKLGARAVDAGPSPGRVEYRAVGASEFVDQLRGHYPDLARELDTFGKELPLVVPRHISISGSLPVSALESVRSVPGIESAESSSDRHQHVVGAFRALRWVARLLIGGLALALLTGLIQLAKINGHLHQDALSVLRLWGAGPLKLRVPGMISGLGVGVLGGLIASTSWLVAGGWLARQVVALSPMFEGMPSPPVQGAFALLIAGILIGAGAGALGFQEGRA